MNQKKSAVDSVRVVFGALSDTFVIVISTIGLIVAALPPAIIFGTALSNSLSVSIGRASGVAAGFGLGVALEAAGVISAHNAIKFYVEWVRHRVRGAEGKFYASAAIVFIYTVIGIVSIVIFDSDQSIRIGGIVAYLIAPMIYVASGMSADTRQFTEERRENLESKAVEQRATLEERREEARHRREMEKLRIEADAGLQKAKVEASTVVKTRREELKYASTGAVGVSSTKFNEFLAFVQANPDAKNNKSRLASELGISRPTVDKYISLMENQNAS